MQESDPSLPGASVCTSLVSLDGSRQDLGLSLLGLSVESAWIWMPTWPGPQQ